MNEGVDSEVSGGVGRGEQVSFVSDAFPRSVEDEAQVNPGRWGFRAADFIRAELAKRGLQVHGPVGEDWGWALSVMHDKDLFMVGCGIVDEEENQFLVFVDSIRPFWKIFGKRPDTAPVVQALDDVLRSSAIIRDVVWVD